MKTIEQMVLARQETVLNVSRSGQVQTSAVSDWIDSGVKPVFRVTTRLGRFVEVTGHHPFLTVNGWTPLHDLQVGNKIAVPRSVPVFGSDNSWETARVRLLAYFIAEGGLSQSTPRFTNTDAVLNADFAVALSQEFPDCKMSLDSDGITQRISHSQGKRAPRFKNVAPNPVTQWLKELDLWGKKADAKFLPDCVWSWTRPHLAEFLRVLFSCDGTIYQLGDYPRIEFSVASQQLARDVQHALLRFGITAKLWRKKERCWRVEITEPASVLTYQIEIGWVGEKAARCREAIARSIPKRASNTGHAPRETWNIIRAACKRRGLSLIELARRAGETTESGYNSHTNRGIPSWRLQRYAEILQDAQLLARRFAGHLLGRNCCN